MQEGGVGADALALEFEKFIVFGDFVPTYPCGRNGGVANGVAQSFSSELPDDAGACVDAFEFAPSLCVFRKSWAIGSGAMDILKCNAISA